MSGCIILLVFTSQSRQEAFASDPPVFIRTKGELKHILQDTDSAWLVFFQQDSQPMVLPSGEDDTRESVWFMKLSSVWLDVYLGKIPWANRSQSPLKFAYADKRQLDVDGASEYFDSEFVSVPTTIWLIDHGRNKGPAPARMDSRKTMHMVLQWADALLAQKEEL